jgi:hypothetical protein
MCADACPQGIDMGAFLLSSRRAMHKKGKLPWAFHDYWLRDMRHAMSSEAAMALMPEAASTPVEYVFFPGCQLGASDPAYVMESYRWLRDAFPGVGLWLSCCGAPAVWSGDEALSGDTFADLRLQWERLGKPKPIFACPTCKKMFNEFLPESDGVFLFNLMRDQGFSPEKRIDGERYSVFDPCSSREEVDLQQAVRDLAERSGVKLEPLASERQWAECCSWGGHVSIANPEYARTVIQKRIGQSDAPYITYCVNCKDIFTESGKGSAHLLDILFGLHGASRPTPGCNERRANRTRLRSMALLEFWDIKEKSAAGVSIDMSEELYRKMADELILVEDIAETITHCELSGRTITDRQTGRKLGYTVVGRMTYWVEYERLAEGGYRLANAYCHRMAIDLEETWRGQKTRADL